MEEIKLHSKILTKRESEILKLLSEGCKNKKISEILNISPLTVKTHRQVLMRKFQVKNCAELIHKATRLNLI